MEFVLLLAGRLIAIASFYYVVTAQCDEPPPAPNTYRTFPNFSTVEYACVDNYFLSSGNLTRTCINNVYTGKTPVCTLSCGAPYNYTPSVNVVYNSTLPESEVIYECSGDTVVNSSTTYCSATTGVWVRADECYKNSGIDTTTFTIWQSTTARRADVLVTPTTATMNSSTTKDLQMFGAGNGFTSTSSISLLDGGCSSTASEQKPELIIDMGKTYVLYGVVVTVPNDDFAFTLPNLYMKKRSSTWNNWYNCKYHSSPITPGSRVLLQCSIYQAYHYNYRYIMLTTDYGSAFGMLQLCDVKILARSTYDVDCGQPTEKPYTRLVQIPATTKYLDRAYYTCIEGYHVRDGRFYSSCQSYGYWSSSLVCTDDVSFALNKSTDSKLHDAHVITDEDVTSCLLLDKSTDGSFVIDLDNDIEVSDVTVVFEDLSGSRISPIITVKVWGNGSRVNVCDSVKLYYSYGDAENVKCKYQPVGRYVGLSIQPFAGLSLCEVYVHGRQFSKALECYVQTKGEDYKGTMNMTVMGLPCQRWDSQSPHGHSYTDVSKFPDDTLENASNYCRNPNGDRHYVWCYTTDPDIEWQYCPVRQCDYMCLRDPTGRQYRGYIRQTTSGKSCISWMETQIQRTSHFIQNPYSSSRCSNPLQSQSQPWCYTSSDSIQYEHCALPECSTTSEVTWGHWDLGEGETLQDLVSTKGECIVWKNFFFDDGVFGNKTSSISVNYYANDDLTVSRVCGTGRMFNMTVLCWENTDDGFVWRTGIMECVHCDQLPDVANTTVSSTSTRLNAIATYACNAGYGHASGSNTVTCLKTGQWETPDMVCLPNCGKPPSVDNTNITNNGTLLNDTAMYRCVPGYSQVTGKSIVTCLNTHQWTDPTIVCVAECGMPPDVLNANITVSGTIENSTAAYTCTGEYTRLAGSGIVTCLGTGAWEVPDTVCGVDCGSPPVVPNTTVTVNNTWINSTAEFTCLDGYAHVSGSTIVTCLGTGSWEDPDIVCQVTTISSTTDVLSFVDSPTSSEDLTLLPTLEESSSRYDVMPSTTSQNFLYPSMSETLTGSMVASFSMSSHSTSSTSSSPTLTTLTSGSGGVVVDKYGRTRKEVCMCRCVSKTSKDKPQDEIVEEIKKELLVDKKALTAYILTKESAEDNRTSSTGMGYVVLVVFGGLFSLLFISDIAAGIKAVLKQVRVGSQ